MAQAEVGAGHAEPNTELLATHALLHTFQDSLGLHRPTDAGRALALVIARRAVALSEAESLKATVVADTIARLGLAPSAHVPLASASARTRRRPGLLCDGCGVTTAPVLFRVQANQGAAARQLLVEVAGRLCREDRCTRGRGTYVTRVCAAQDSYLLLARK